MILKQNELFVTNPKHSLELEWIFNQNIRKLIEGKLKIKGKQERLQLIKLTKMGETNEVTKLSSIK